MVRKLMRHEYKAFMKPLIPMYIIMLAAAAILRVTQLFESSARAYKVVYISLIVALVLSILAGLVITVILGVVRFYNGLFSQEGYLSGMLPVTPAQQLTARIRVTMGATLISILVSIVSALIALIGDPISEGYKAFIYLWRECTEAIGFNVWLFALELIFAALLLILEKYTLLFACVSLGQRSHKRRILHALLAYFCFWLIRQVIGTVIIIFSDSFAKLWIIRQIIENDVITDSIHALFSLISLIYIGVTMVLGFISHRTLTDHLNLE